MKNFLIVLSLTTFLFSCTESKTSETKEAAKNTTVASGEPMFFGEKISPDSAQSIDNLETMMGTNTELNCKVTGKVESVCQKKGCWMKIVRAQGDPIHVMFKDYGFFMPKDGSGKTAIMDGIAKIEETSVADLQEYAKDDGQTAEQIAAIKEPKKEIVFEARGVILQ